MTKARRIAFAALIFSTCSCSSVDSSIPKSLGDNEYLFVVLSRNALINSEQFEFATMRARAFCNRSGLRHNVDVEPEEANENGAPVDVYHFSCEKREDDSEQLVFD